MNWTLLLITAWLVSGIIWMAVVLWLLWLAVGDLRDTRLPSRDDALLTIQRRANIWLYGLLVAATACGVVAGVSSFVSQAWPPTAMAMRVLAIASLIGLQTFGGLVGVHLWRTRTAVNKSWEATVGAARRRTADSPTPTPP